MVEVVGHGYDEERQFYIVHLAAAPASPPLTLNIFFTGNLNDELAGFYRSGPSSFSPSCSSPSCCTSPQELLHQDGHRGGDLAGHHPVRGDRRQASLPLLRRARHEGHIPGHTSSFLLLFFSSFSPPPPPSSLFSFSFPFKIFSPHPSFPSSYS